MLATNHIFQHPSVGHSFAQKRYGVIGSGFTAIDVFIDQSLECERADSTGVLLREGTRLQ